jgi:NDP-sugar pyrophosphorylase family protein
VLGILLAAGKGTRMRPLSEVRPKPLLPVLDVPLLAWALGRAAAAGVNQFYVNASQNQEGLPAVALAYGEKIEVEVLISREPAEPLGTAGALRRMEPEIRSTFLIINTDTACDLPIQDLVFAHQSARGIATLLAIPTDEGADFVVEEGWITDLIDPGEPSGAGHLYGGCGIFEPEILDYVPRGASGLYETVMKGAMADDKGLSAVEWTGYYRDVATPQSYLSANLDALAGVLSSQGIPQSLGEPPVLSEPTAFVARGASVTDVELRHTVVGRDARIAPDSRLERCVVWDGVEVEGGDYKDSILTENGIVKL